MRLDAVTELLPVKPPPVSSQADAVAKGQRIAADAQRGVAGIVSRVVTVAERETRKVRRIDDRWTRGAERNTPIREREPKPEAQAKRWLPTYREARAKLLDLNQRGWRVSYSEAKVNDALARLDAAVIKARGDAEAVVAQAQAELFALSSLYGVDSPMFQGVYNAILVNGPRGEHFDLACDASRKMVKERGTDQVAGTYEGEDGKQHAIPSIPRSVSYSLSCVVAANSTIADTMKGLARSAERIAWWSWLGHSLCVWRERDAEPVWGLERYAKAEARAFAAVGAALVGATSAITRTQALYPRASDFFTGALDAVQPNIALYDSFKVAAKAPRALVHARGDRPKANALAPREQPRDPREEHAALVQVEAAREIALTGEAGGDGERA